MTGSRNGGAPMAAAHSARSCAISCAERGMISSIGSVVNIEFGSERPHGPSEPLLLTSKTQSDYEARICSL